MKKGKVSAGELPVTGRAIQKRVFKRLKKYDKLNSLEHFAMFMGTSQVLEFGLKRLLHRLYKYDLEDIDRWTLGSTSRELEKCGLRADFVAFLKSVVKYRNYVAHEFLANEAMLRVFLGKNIGRLESKRLQVATYELEQIMFLYDWCEEHDAWAV